MDMFRVTPVPISVWAAAALLLTGPSDVRGQTFSSSPSWADSFVVVAPGPQYAKGGLYRALFGAHNRDLWATRVRVPVLPLDRFAGGLTPIQSHAGSQTQSLRFQGADGRQYQFRSVDKDPTIALAPELRRTAAAKVLQDGVSTSHPVGALVASALLEAAGVLHVEQTLAVLPDDPALGEFRKDFAGVFGMIEERPSDGTERRTAFAGARNVISPATLFARLDRSPDDRVDARAFLVARLMDILMGDRDRHRDQFRWATFSDSSPLMWLPISRDHDEAFVKIDGPVLDVVRLYYPPLVNFTEDYPAHFRLNWHAREIDRRFLVGLDRHTWDSVATALQATLTDNVIDGAARHLPPEMYAVSGAKLAHVLKARRDKLVQEALSYYAFLAEEVEIHATDAAERATITRVDDQHLEVAVAARGDKPYFQRRFDARETHEIRLKMWGGADRVIVRGAGNPAITVRIIGGGGDDGFADSTQRGGARWYDDSGKTTLVSLRNEAVNAKPFKEWVGSDTNRYPPRDWGTWSRPIPWVTANSDLGLFIGGGLWRTEYGFRRTPYASHIQARVGYATGAIAGRADFIADLRPENTQTHWRVGLLASGIEVLRYYGLGNATAATGGQNFYKVKQQHYGAAVSLVFPVARLLEVSVGPLVRWTHVADNTGRFIAGIADTTYGAGDFGEFGGRLALQLDTRDQPANARRGVHLHGEGRFFPAIWDVSRSFGSVEGDAATYLSAPVWLKPTLVLRAGGKQIWGPFPFQDAAFIGGHSTLPGFYRERFAGDASVYGNAELRLTLLRSYWIMPALWGAFGSANAGRVYVDGDSPGGWHNSAGGGIWVAFLDRANTATVGFANSTEGTLFYVGVGFPF
jgi:hypothetical protein